MIRQTFWVVLFACVLFAFSACGTSDGSDNPDGDADGDTPDGDNPDGDTPDGDTPDGDTPDGDMDGDEDGDVDGDADKPGQVVSGSFKVRGTVEQIYIWLADPDTEMEVVNADGEIVATGTTDYQGSWVVRELTPGPDHVVRLADDPDDYTDMIDVMSVEGSQPDEAFYESQTLVPGYQYITMRDGTKLAAFVSLPGPVEDGPYPTVVNISGYTPSKPGKSLGGAAELFCGDFPILCDAPDHPSGLIAGLMGYASVGVNLRGTGCSGGAYDYFEKLQLLDGYDVIEIVANQDWVKHNHVGMVGLSFPGITQLFVASTRPPHLAAITPFSVIADTYSSTLLPGGIYNNGFALEWIEMVLNKSEPYAHSYIQDLVDAGDTVCEESQLLHSQKVDAVNKALENPYYSDELGKPIDPTAFVNQIDVPVFLTGQCQDEQTGPHYPALFDKFTGSPLTRFTMTNGVHIDGFSTQILAEWMNFLDLYVAEEIPDIPDDVATLVPFFMGEVFGSSKMKLPEERFADYTSYDDALADYEAEEPIRVIFESGADPDVDAGAPIGTFETHFSAWPPDEVAPLRLYFQPDGTLAETEPDAQGGASSFTHDADAGNRISLESGSINDLQPGWDYRQPQAGMAVAFMTDALDDDLVMVGPGSVDIWIQSTADDADLEVTLTEVRPDGKETQVQNGWLRASHRTLLPESSNLRPVSSHYQEDVQPLPAGEWVLVRVEIMPMVHIFRAGSKIRLVIDTPGDNCARWRFLLLEFDTPPTNSVAHNSDYPSSVVLPVIPNIDVPTELPPVNALRGQPWRDYTPYTNTPMTAE